MLSSWPCPHGVAAGLVFGLVDPRGVPLIDLGPDFRLRAAPDYPRWYGFEHPRPELLAGAVSGCRSSTARSSPRSATARRRPAGTWARLG